MEYRPPGWKDFKISRCIHRQGIREAGIEPDTCDTCSTTIDVCHFELEEGASAMGDHILSLLKEKAPSSVIIDILSGYECKR